MALHCLIYLNASAVPCDTFKRERDGKAPEKAVCGEEYCRVWLRLLTAGKPQQRVEKNLSHETHGLEDRMGGKIPFEALAFNTI
jgi:hypothetical protein